MRQSPGKLRQDMCARYESKYITLCFDAIPKEERQGIPPKLVTEISSVWPTDRKDYRIGPYARGYRYCSRCARYWLTQKIHCPDCGNKLRSKAKDRYRTNRPDKFRIKRQTKSVN